MAANYGPTKSISYAYENAGNLIQSVRPSPGLLAGSLEGNQVTLAWPAALAGSHLQDCAPGPNARWTDVPGTPIQSGNLISFTLRLSSTGFYRLLRPGH